MGLERAGDCCVSENGGGVYWEARRFRINLLKISPTRHTVSPNPQTLKMTVEMLDVVSSLALMDERGGGGIGGDYSNVKLNICHILAYFFSLCLPST